MREARVCAGESACLRKLSSLNDTLPSLPLTEREIDMKMAEEWERRGEMERRGDGWEEGRRGRGKKGGMRWKVRREEDLNGG